MKKCLNCGTVCDDWAAQCPHCRMRGQFRRMVEETPPAAGPSPQKTDWACRNCGSGISSGSVKCPHCKIPLQAADLAVFVLPGTPVVPFSKLKTA